MPSAEDDEKLPDDEATPRKRRRSDDVDDKPRIANSERMPLLMLLGLIVGTLLILSSCGLGGWFMWGWLVAGGSGGSGGGGGAFFGNEFEVTGASKTPGLRPNIGWSVVAKKTPDTRTGFYYLVLKCGNQTVTESLTPDKAGWSRSGGGQYLGLSGGDTLEVWVEKRTNPVATGKVVSNVFKVP